MSVVYSLGFSQEQVNFEILAGEQIFAICTAYVYVYSMCF